MVITGDFFGRMERFGITLVNELEAIHVLSRVPRRGTLMVSRMILGCKNTLFQKILDGNLEIYVLFGDDMEKIMHQRILSCLGFHVVVNARFSSSTRGSFLNFQVFLSLNASLNASHISGLSWGFLVLQQILYILRALPMRTGTEYHCASEKDGYMVWICCSRIWHADALNTLANANRMVAAQYGIRKYSVCRAYFKLKNDKLGSFFHILKMDMRIFLWDPGDFLQDFFLKDSKYQSHPKPLYLTYTVHVSVCLLLFIIFSIISKVTGEELILQIAAVFFFKNFKSIRVAFIGAILCPFWGDVLCVVFN